MADAFYTELRENTVDQLIGEFGQQLTLRVEGSGAVFDGATGFVTTPGTDVDYSVLGAIFDIKQIEIDGTNVLHGDKRVLISPLNPATGEELAVVPDTKMQLVANGVVYAIVDVDEINPGGVVVMYKLQART